MRNLVLKRKEEYTLITRVNELGLVNDYVVAWNYDALTDTWQQGHYFNDLSNAMTYLEETEKNPSKKRIKLLKAMNNYVLNELGDEDAYMTWITLAVPDEGDESDYEFIAGDNDCWKESCSCFGSLIKEYDCIV